MRYARWLSLFLSVLNAVRILQSVCQLRETRGVCARSVDILVHQVTLALLTLEVEVDARVHRQLVGKETELEDRLLWNERSDKVLKGRCNQ